MFTISKMVTLSWSGQDCWLRCTMPSGQLAHYASALRFNMWGGPNGQKFELDAIMKWCAENVK